MLTPPWRASTDATAAALSLAVVGAAGQAKLGKALTNQDRAEKAKVKALDKLAKATRRK